MTGVAIIRFRKSARLVSYLDVAHDKGARVYPKLVAVGRERDDEFGSVEFGKRSNQRCERTAPRVPNVKGQVEYFMQTLRI